MVTKLFGRPRCSYAVSQLFHCPIYSPCLSFEAGTLSTVGYRIHEHVPVRRVVDSELSRSAPVAT